VFVFVCLRVRVCALHLERVVVFLLCPEPEACTLKTWTRCHTVSTKPQNPNTEPYCEPIYIGVCV